MAAYEDFYQQSLIEKEYFWRRQAWAVRWFDFPEDILTKNKEGFYRWYASGKLNTSYLALDYHVDNGRVRIYISGRRAL